MEHNSENEVGIVVTYWIDGENRETFSERFSDIDTRNNGMEIPKPPDLFPGDYNYSGRHDNGELPPLRERTEFRRLLACVKEAKDHNDRFVTEKIQEIKSRQVKEDDSNPPNKKTKV